MPGQVSRCTPPGENVRDDFGVHYPIMRWILAVGTLEDPSCDQMMQISVSKMLQIIIAAVGTKASILTSQEFESQRLSFSSNTSCTTESIKPPSSAKSKIHNSGEQYQATYCCCSKLFAPTAICTSQPKYGFGSTNQWHIGSLYLIETCFAITNFRSPAITLPLPTEYP